MEACATTPAQESGTEKSLVAAAQAGDRQAFECLIIGCQSRLLRWLTRLTQNPMVAEELLQETWVKAFVSLQQFRGEAAFATWVARIARNTFLAWKQQQARLPEQNGLDDTLDNLSLSENSWCDWPTYSESPETLLGQQELNTVLIQAISALPELHRQALTLREQEGLNYEAIARIQQVPIGTVRSRIHRARETLARHLKEQMEPV